MAAPAVRGTCLARSTVTVMRNFRRTLMDLVLVAAPALSVAACHSGEEMIDAPATGYNPCETYEATVPEPPPARLLDLVRQCEADPTRCEPLCSQILYDSGYYYSTIESCTVQHSSTAHVVKVGYCQIVVEGRRPPGLANARRRCPDATGAHLARAAFFEAASIHAFVQLARELSHHRAPRKLVHAVRRAAADEIRHARTMAALAHARGATPPRLAVAPQRVRSIEAIALENAREGVVGETWSALTALWQSQHAPSEALRKTFAQIAADEVRHAELARALATWTDSRLRPTARKRVAAERARAVAKLAQNVRHGATIPELVQTLGIPDRAVKQQLFKSARETLWS